jgi:uncharacterized membrane protein YfcA
VQTGAANDWAITIKLVSASAMASWAVLVPTKFWTRPMEDSWARRVVMLILGGLIGTRSAKSLSERRGALNIVFAVVIIAVAIYMLVRNLSLS